MDTSETTNIDESKLERRSFLMRHGIIGAAAIMTGKMWTPEARAAQAAKEAGAPKPSKLSPSSPR